MLLFWPTSRLSSLLLPFLLVAACHNTAVNASKDDSYYAANSGNPNTNLKMYWKDAENVLQDLSKFGSLYVQFHSCVWSWMHPTQSGYNDEDIDENDYWYMGSVPSMGPNVAFSLYGSLKGHSFEGCTSNTFINSFYTDAGFEDFAASMYAAGVSGFSAYASSGNGDDDYSYSSSSSSSSYGSSCYGGYGVGCDSTNGFALHKYASDECDPKYATEVADTLSSLNSAMSQATCVKIFDGSSYSSSSSSSSSSYSSSYSISSSSALALLKYSTACNYMNYWSPDGDCPDPYNKIAYYINNFSNGIKHKHPDPYQWYYADMAAGRAMMRKGLVFFGLAAVVVLLGWTSHLWMPKWPTIHLPKWPKQQKKKPPVKNIDLEVFSGTAEDGCVVPSRSWFWFGGDSGAGANSNNNDDPSMVKSFDSTASQQHKKKKSKKRKRKNTAISDTASVKSVDSAYQLHEEEEEEDVVVAAAPGAATSAIDEDETVPASTSWFSFGSSSRVTKKDKKTPQDAPGDVATSTSWFSALASGKKDASPSPRAVKKKEKDTFASTAAVIKKHDSKDETGIATSNKATAPDVEKEATAPVTKEEEQPKEDVPVITNWFSFTSTPEKEEEPNAYQSGFKELVDPKPDDVNGEDQPRTKTNSNDDITRTDNNKNAIPSATSWFSIMSDSKKKKVEEALSEDAANKIKIDEETNRSVPPPEDSAVPAASWFSFLSSTKKHDNDKDTDDDNANAYTLHEEVQQVSSPQEEKDPATAYTSMDKVEAETAVEDETPGERELVDDSHYALLTTVSSLTCDQTTVTHLDEDTAPKHAVEEKAASEYAPLNKALNAVPELAAETTSNPSQEESSDSLPGTKVIDNVNYAKEATDEHADEEDQAKEENVKEDKAMEENVKEDEAKEDVPAITSWFSFTSPPEKEKEPTGCQSAVMELLDPEPDPTCEGSDSLPDTQVMDNVNFAKETTDEHADKEDQAKEENIKEDQANKEHVKEGQVKEDVPAITSWFSFTSPPEKEEEPNGCQNAVMELLDPEPEPTWQDEQPRTNDHGIDDNTKTDNNEEALPSATSWFSFTSSSKKKKVKEAPKEDDVDMTKIYQKANRPDSEPETKVTDNTNGSAKTLEEEIDETSKTSPPPMVSEKHSKPKPKAEMIDVKSKEAGISICHEHAKVEAVVSGDGSDIQSVTPSELVATLSRQSKVVQEINEDEIHQRTSKEAEEAVIPGALPDLQSDGTTQSNTPEEMAARVLAAQSRRDGESMIEGAFSDARSVGTARSLTPEELAARILKERLAKKKEEGE